ncbi:MAG: DUF4276 family protein [Bacteroidetes bacterium]|nr:MAG: DUF4276 family protein [Bacteroidota bacterium]
MMKIAVFVEGQTELIFVREMLLKVFKYQNISLACYTLHNDNERNPTEYEYRNDEAPIYFEILNVGNDAKVLPAILKRERYMWSDTQGFDKIIGLRDMYSKNYREVVETHQISEEVNQKFIEGATKTIQDKAQKPEKISFHFAIMEVEAWLLGLKEWLQRIDNRLTTNYIAQNLAYNLEVINPETAFFHPAKFLEEIYDLADKEYDKKKGDVYKIMSFLEKQDFIDLANSDKCNSFKEFYTSLNP